MPFAAGLRDNQKITLTAGRPRMLSGVFFVRKVYVMKKFLYIVIPFVLFLFSPCHSEAGYNYNGTEYQYYFYSAKSDGSDSVKAYFNVVKEGWYPFICGYAGSDHSSQVFPLSGCDTLVFTDGSKCMDPYVSSQHIQYYNGVYIRNGGQPESKITTSLYHDVYGFSLVETNIPIFQSYDAAIAYYSTGDTTGSYYIPEPPAPEYDSVPYDFTQDLYNPQYPLPELSDLSYDSFFIHNPDGYSFDLVVQTTFYGTKMQKYSEGGNHYMTDKSRKFRQHEYNFTLSDPLNISGSVNIKDIYSVDLLETLKSDWIEWSEHYPTLDTLPGYSWVNAIGYTSRDYKNYRVYNEDFMLEHGLDLLAALNFTGCCEVKFFVRYRDDNGYGQWMVYTVCDTDSDGFYAETGDTGKPSFITTGAVSGSTASGVPIVTDPVTQHYDPINEQYDVILDDGSDIDWNLSVENFQSAFSFFGEMPNLVSTVFSCYPSWMVSIIGATITFLCALAIYHGIRG